MSIYLMTQAWKSQRPTGQKMVLLALCDNANDQGQCYPAVPTIAAKCSMGIRTVQEHLSAMEADGALYREERRGRSTIYHLFPGKFDVSDTPAESAPPQNPHPSTRGNGGAANTPAESAPPQNPHPTPAKNSGKPPQNPHPTPADFAPRTVSKPSKPSRKRETARATRLPSDWRLPKKWGEETLKKYPHWTVEFIRELGEAFRDHWVAIGGQKGTKLDWEATWRNWCRNETHRPQARAGGAGGAMGWWKSEEGILAKGREMGMTPNRGEMMPSFEARVRAAIDNGGKPPPPMPSRLPQAYTPLPEDGGPQGAGAVDPKEQLSHLKTLTKSRKKSKDETGND